MHYCFSQVEKLFPEAEYARVYLFVIPQTLSEVNRRRKENHDLNLLVDWFQPLEKNHENSSGRGKRALCRK